MEVKTAEFIAGITGEYERMRTLPSIAFFGRSNVGKSSLINMLLDRKRLARPSSSPGKTREANHYLINGAFYCIDFPGYGYARLPQALRNKIAKRILWYVRHNPTPPAVSVLVVDARVGLTVHDRKMLEELIGAGHTVCIAATKIDKLKRNEVDRRIDMIARSANQRAGSRIPVVAVSSHTKAGRDILWRVFESTLSKIKYDRTK